MSLETQQDFADMTITNLRKNSTKRLGNWQQMIGDGAVGSAFSTHMSRA